MSTCGENYGQNVGRTCEHAANSWQGICLQHTEDAKKKCINILTHSLPAI